MALRAFSMAHRVHAHTPSTRTFQKKERNEWKRGFMVMACISLPHWSDPIVTA